MHRVALLLLLLSAKCFAQDSLKIQAYIDQYKAAAIAEMQRTGIPAAITLAQGIHESAAGTSPLTIASNNHFGIKCKTGWAGPSVTHDDDAKGECFRSYTCPQDSYKDHSDFLKANGRYAFLFGYDPLDYEAWAKGLKQAGYATNPRYPQILIKTIERFHLNDLSLLALDKTNSFGNDIAVANTQSVLIAATTASSATGFKMDTTATAFQPPVRHIPNGSFDIAIPYPTGVFSINGSRVIFAERGTSLLALAMQHHVSLPNLLAWNDMYRGEIVEESQLIFIERKPKKCKAAYHEVKPGETLWQISQQEGIRLANLMQYNQFTAANIQLMEGRRLMLN